MVQVQFFKLIFFLGNVPIAENEVPYYYCVVVLSISPFRPVSICLTHLGALMLGAYMIVASS